ncbi:MAG TPA: ester cyclase [Ktedonobacteraceae bacterium]|nr:ester cyclase [Ktedonobacteraceae bacterium]
MEATEVVKTFITALQSGDMELAAHTMTDDFKTSGLLPGRELNARELLALQSELLVAMPDFSYNLTEVQEEGDEVRALVQITGTQTGDLSLTLLGLRTIPATGLAVDLAQLPTRYRVADDKVTEMHVDSQPGAGLTGLLQQAGAEIPLLTRDKTFNDPAYPQDTASTHNIGE